MGTGYRVQGTYACYLEMGNRYSVLGNGYWELHGYCAPYISTCKIVDIYLSNNKLERDSKLVKSQSRPVCTLTRVVLKKALANSAVLGGNIPMGESSQCGSPKGTVIYVKRYTNAVFIGLFVSTIRVQIWSTVYPYPLLK